MALTTEDKKRCDELGAKIRAEEASAAKSFLKIGAYFTEAKARLLKHETFTAWVAEQTSFSVRHANRLIKVAHYCRTNGLGPEDVQSQRQILAAMDGIRKAEEAEELLLEAADRTEERDTRVPSEEMQDPAGITGVTLERSAEELARLDGLGALTSSNSQEHYSPPRITDAGRFVLGRIDLDPASCAEANERVGANVFYTKEDDGLTKPWAGNVFLNWPGGKDEHGQSNASKFSRKLIASYADHSVANAFVVIFKWMHSESWLSELLDLQPDVCLLDSRTNFVLPGGELQTGMPHCSGVLLLSEDNDVRRRFRDRMATMGRVIDGSAITPCNVVTIDVAARGEG